MSKVVNCDVCRIVMSESDVPSHNTGKRHAKNLIKMKQVKDHFNKFVILKKESNLTIEKESVQLSNTAQPTVSTPVSMKIQNADRDEVSAASKLDEGKLQSKSEEVPSKSEVTVPSKPNDVTEPASTKPTQKTPEGQKKWKKRKFKEEASKPSLPDVFINIHHNFDIQAMNFIMQIEQTQQKWDAIRLVLNDVMYIFRSVIPDVQPVLYGSSFTGLAFKTSDIDVYLYDPRGGEPDRDFILRDGRVIYRRGLFSNIVRIVTARVPVIKATHTSTGIDLDISVTSGQAVANSRLLRHLLSNDCRIRSLMMLIGYYGKKYGIICVNKFSRYAINLLIVFYLQNLPAPILPPLSQLVYGDPQRLWPYAFNEDRQMLKNSNSQCLAGLFMGFFEFYRDFEFDKYVISTYIGRKIAVEDMEKEEILNQMIFYKNYLLNGGRPIPHRCMCVQDPLELCHNITKGVTEKVLLQLRYICENVLKIKEAAGEGYWLTDLMTMPHIPPFVKKSPENSVSVVVPFMSDSECEWTESIKEPLQLVFETLAMEVNWDCPLAKDEAKKFKSAPGITFSVETKQFTSPKSLRWLLKQLKLGELNIMQVKYQISQTAVTKNHSVFNAHCFVSADQPNFIKLTMANSSADKHAFLMQMKHYIQILLTAALPKVQNQIELKEESEKQKSKESI